MRRLLLNGLLVLLCSLSAVKGAAAKEEKVPFRNWQQIRTAGVVMQRLDFSCGAASLATLSTFFLNKPLTEETLLRIIRARYTDAGWKQKKQDGLSMEDLVFMAERVGLKAEGGIIGLAGLLKLNGPVIVHLDKKEFQHFTVLRGIHGMTVYLSDPSLGTVPMSLSSFVDQFTGAVLAVWDPGKSVPTSYPIKLKDQDKFYDRLPDMVHPHFYERPQSLQKNF